MPQTREDPLWKNPKVDARGRLHVELGQFQDALNSISSAVQRCAALAGHGDPALTEMESELIRVAACLAADFDKLVWRAEEATIDEFCHAVARALLLVARPGCE